MAISLLQRLEQDVTEGQYTSLDQFEAALMDSILEDLRILLNSMSGCCETRPDFGLADFNSVNQSHKDTAAELCRDIERQIQMFEPRLRNPVVRSIEDPDKPLEFVFNVEADLEYGGRSVRIRFDSVLDSTGKVRLTA
ncbi:type VI secretion system baseplate subunit TssE [Roseibium denhamense]|uniref:Type VI secretion system protein n=1 Tax=Roseibium denhamense TaxID=76305 RepID=A0ABY1NYF7_9HYPH|nr:type VI secretion system baseplate subunit TssE [Roseibium denhamense]SMP20099.1 type VI secretion system protein [Roseibium denhamense]